MGASCCGPEHDHGHSHAAPSGTDRAYRRVLWAALSANALMFAVEVAAGLGAQSVALLADALDFLGDAANYGVSLFVLGMSLAWRARAALLKSFSMAAFGAWVAGTALHHALAGSVPDARVMGAVGLLALATNLGVALLLFRHRDGDANRRSVWICTRNDAIGNLAVMAAALGVFGTGTLWPDVFVAAIMAALALWGAAQVMRQAVRELRSDRRVLIAAE
ncbi:MAG TPA: cation transporter [Vineibacter sp.]|nr:cation transporter [Vineibacter sp.]